jgi:hypothetical protein
MAEVKEVLDKDTLARLEAYVDYLTALAKVKEASK